MGTTMFFNSYPLPLKITKHVSLRLYMNEKNQKKTTLTAVGPLPVTGANCRWLLEIKFFNINLNSK